MQEKIQEFARFAQSKIQGVFGIGEMETMQEEIAKLKSGDVYLEIGVNEGLSMAFAHQFTEEGVKIIGIDIIDVPPHPASVGRAPWMQDVLPMCGIGRRAFYVHGDADIFVELFNKPFINVLFIDGHHDYESVKKNTLMWENMVVPGGVILFHDYDHPDTKRWLDEHYGSDKEVFYNKMVKVKK